jgi:hypothetical protein
MAVPENSECRPQMFQLWYGKILVADLGNVIVHQGTWFGRYQLLLTPEQGEQEKRLFAYVLFCEDWHNRLEQGMNHDAAEFDTFDDVLRSGTWHFRGPDGSDLTIPVGPIFVDGEASWNHPNSEPNRELAALQAWSRCCKANP